LNVNAPNQSASGENGNAAEQNFSVTPPAINLPKSGGAIRGMGEKFPANPVTGTGSMTVIFYSPFYGRAKFCCKSAQFCVTRCKSRMAESPRIGDAVQSSETLRNSLGLN
jgi:hypothetical protein